MIQLRMWALISNCPAGHPPPGLGLWGQTADKQTTNKPENQQSNEPTDQQTNKPTRQQTNTTTSNKSRNEPPNQPKNHQKINQKSTKMAPKSVLEAVLGASWGFLGCLGAILAPRWPQEPKKWKSGDSSYASWGASWEPKSTQNRSGGLPKSDHFFDCLWGRVLLPLGPNLAPTWPPKPSQNRAKLAPRSIKKSIIWVLVGKMSQIAKNPKFADSSTLLIDFWCLGRSTWHPKPTQIRSKSLPKSIKQGIENMMQVGLVFRTLLARIWVDLASKLEGKLDQDRPV